MTCGLVACTAMIAGPYEDEGVLWCYVRSVGNPTLCDLFIVFLC